MNKKGHNKVYIRTGFIFIAIGLIGLGFPFLSLGFLGEYSFLSSLAKTKDVEVQQQQASANQQFVEPGSVIATPTPVPPAPDYALKGIKDRLVISNIGVDMPIFHTSDANILWKGGWIFPGTSTPDKGGNTVIFGHRFRYLPPVSNTFFSLNKVKVGDEFQITWQGREYRYRIAEIKTIEPTDVYILNPTSNAQVTLVTCAPLFSTKQRLVVIGTLI